MEVFRTFKAMEDHTVITLCLRMKGAPRGACYLDPHPRARAGAPAGAPRLQQPPASTGKWRERWKQGQLTHSHSS